MKDQDLVNRHSVLGIVCSVLPLLVLVLIFKFSAATLASLRDLPEA